MSVPCTRHAIRRIDPERPTPLTWLLNRKENPLQYDRRRFSTVCFVLPLYVFKLLLLIFPLFFFFSPIFISFFPFNLLVSLVYGKEREEWDNYQYRYSSNIPPIPSLTHAVANDESFLATFFLFFFFFYIYIKKK